MTRERSHVTGDPLCDGTATCDCDIWEALREGDRFDRDFDAALRQHDAQTYRGDMAQLRARIVGPR